jgi:drug/metabolite transporter (DMT)-like permease
MWVLFALLCSLLNALQGAHGKRILNRLDHHVVTWAMFAYGLPLVTVALVLEGIPDISAPFWPAILITVTINLLAITLYIRALHLSPLSLTIPLLAFTPIVLILTGYIALGELPDTVGTAGILLIVVGAYILNLDKLNEGFLAPLHAIVGERGSLLMFIAAILWGISATADKVAMINSSPLFYLVAFDLLFLILYIPVLRARASGHLRKAVSSTPQLLVFALLGVLMMFFQLAALRTGLVSYVIAIKRAGMVFSILLGYFFFGEGHLKIRLMAAALMVTGVCCIVL